MVCSLNAGEKEMDGKIVKAKIFRYDPSRDNEHYYKTYEVPLMKGMSVMDALDYIYQNIDSTLSYYDHAGCALGICGKCTCRINGKAGLLCQTELEGDVTVEPISQINILKDLVVTKDMKRG